MYRLKVLRVQVSVKGQRDSYHSEQHRMSWLSIQHLQVLKVLICMPGVGLMVRVVSLES